MAAVGAASSRLPRLGAIPGALDAVYALFDKMKWTGNMPREVTLLKDPEARAILEGRLPGAQAPYTPIKRSQIQYQFTIWKKLGTRAASAASSKSDYQIKIIVESRVAQRGGVGALQELAFASVAQSRLLVHLRPSFMPTKIAALRRSTQVITFFTERVHQVMEQIVRSYARRASAVTSSSADFEFHRYASQQQLKKRWLEIPDVACIFAEIPDGCDLIADNLLHLSIMTFVELDNEITTELRKCFGLSVGVADLDIPLYDDHDGTQLGLAVQSTLYYIAGAMVSALQKLAGRTARTNSSLSQDLTVFCARNTVKRADAEAIGLPCGLVSSRSEGKLLYYKPKVVSDFVFYSYSCSYSHIFT